MRLLNIRTEEGDRCGVLAGDAVIDAQRALASLGTDIEPGIRAFLSRPDWRELGRRVADLGPASEFATPRAGVDVGPVIPDPQKIIFVGGNTHSHLKEAAPYTNATAPVRPMLTSKTPNAVNGPYDPIVQPAGTSHMDYEAELCVVIGTRARRVAEADVVNVLAGYSVVNDVSDREYQLSSWEDNSFYRTHFLGKSFDGFCPCGPELVTPDEIADLDSLRVTCTVNGEVKQDDVLSDLCFSVEEIVSYLSMGVTLEPGDLILMGSPAGVAHFLDPPPYVGPGDVVRCEVESIGYIENPIVAEAVGAG
jgi:2-keto-4-pentenoate hydratase/2-oxohepta-3-ene-1,7-dioic acid hydratase in catechol pathway